MIKPCDQVNLEHPSYYETLEDEEEEGLEEEEEDDDGDEKATWFHWFAK